MKTLARYFVITGSYSPDEKRELSKKLNVLGGVLLESKVIVTAKPLHVLGH
jgi:hypothetical protein